MSTATPLIIKVGGALLTSEATAKSLFRVIGQLLSVRPVVLVHGGGSAVNQLITKLGYRSDKINGLRITPPQHLPYVVGTLAGTVNKTLCHWAMSQGLIPVGLSLLDGNMCTARQLSVELGAVGAVQPGCKHLLSAIMELQQLAVISSIAAHPDEGLLNVNADDAAVAIAELVDGQLLLLSDVPCVLDADQQAITQLTATRSAELQAKGVIRDGMAVKVNAAGRAANKLGKPVIIASWKQPRQLLGLLAEQAIGTQVMADASTIADQ